MGRLLACIRICMGIGSMSVGFPLVASPEEPSSDKTDVLEVKDVVISCTRLPGEAVDARTLPAKVTIITADDIKKSGAKTVQELPASSCTTRSGIVSNRRSIFGDSMDSPYHYRFETSRKG